MSLHDEQARNETRLWDAPACGRGRNFLIFIAVSGAEVSAVS